MTLNIIIYEDNKFPDFYPLTYLRPVYALRAGIVPLFERCLRIFPESQISLTCREQIAPVVADRYKSYPVNIIKKNGNSTLLLNGRIKDFGDIVKLVSDARISTIFKNNDEIVGVILKNESLDSLPALATLKEYIELIKSEGEDIPYFDTSATLYNHCWEIMHDIEKEITDDFNFLRSNFVKPSDVKIHKGAYCLNQDDVYIGSNVEVFPGAIIDATKGPIFIGDYTKIESHAAIYGPAYIGANSIITAGKISSSSIGHTCRVGGEVEESVFQSYVNKYHAGFIGHSYVGSWVNFGAMTTNSDLKNNYSNIRVSLNGITKDTASNKIGSFIGDHTKFGIGTLLNTGINIGICCNLFGGTLITDKEIASFSWGQSGNYQKYDIDKCIETVKAVAARRNHEFKPQEIELIKQLSKNEINNKGIFEIICRN